LAGDLNDEQSVLNEDSDAFAISGFKKDPGCDHAENGVDVGADDGQAGPNVIKLFTSAIYKWS